MGHYVWKSSACMLLFNSNNSGDQKRYKDERVTDTNEKCRQVLTERGRYVSNVKKKNLRSIKEDIILARKSLYDKLCCISHSRLWRLPSTRLCIFLQVDPVQEKKIENLITLVNYSICLHHYRLSETFLAKL